MHMLYDSESFVVVHMLPDAIAPRRRWKTPSTATPVWPRTQSWCIEGSLFFWIKTGSSALPISANSYLFNSKLRHCTPALAHFLPHRLQGIRR